MTEHVKIRKMLKEDISKLDFYSLLDKCILTPRQKEIMQLYYIQGKSMSYIADTLGYCEQTIKEEHRRVIKKLSKQI